MKLISKIITDIGLATLAVILFSNTALAQEKPVGLSVESTQVNQTENLVSQNYYSPPANKENYIGASVLIGEQGDYFDFAVISKVKLFNLSSWGSVSARPSVTFIDGDVGFRVPATLDWLKLDKFVPFAGAGAAIDSDGDADLMLTGGTDYKLSRDWTLNGTANLLFLGDTTLDVTLGIGYNF